MRILDYTPTIDDYLCGKIGKNNKWEDIDTYCTEWEKRIFTLVDLAFSNAPSLITSIMDLGSGPEWTRKFLPAGCLYFPIDMKKITEHTLVYDLNQQQFPDISSDLILISGCLEYLNNLGWIVQNCSKRCTYVVCSYCSLDIHPNIESRRQLCWVNDLSCMSLIDLFLEHKFQLLVHKVFSLNDLFLFKTNN